MEESKPKKLTPKEKRFCEFYIIDFNGANAARKAGYSEHTARTIASKLLTNIDIKAEIKRLLDEKSMGEEEIKARIDEIGRGDIADLLDIHSTGYNLKLMVKNEKGELIVNPKTKLIRKIKQKVVTHIGKKDDDDDVEVIDTEFELYNAQSALEFLAKMRGMVTEKVDMTSQGKSINIDEEKSNRALMALSNALGKIIPDQGTEQNSLMGSSE